MYHPNLSRIYGPHIIDAPPATSAIDRRMATWEDMYLADDGNWYFPAMPVNARDGNEGRSYNSKLKQLRESHRIAILHFPLH
jgi:hypothetical protein